MSEYAVHKQFQVWLEETSWTEKTNTIVSVTTFNREHFRTVSIANNTRRWDSVHKSDSSYGIVLFVQIYKIGWLANTHWCPKSNPKLNQHVWNNKFLDLSKSMLKNKTLPFGDRKHSDFVLNTAGRTKAKAFRCDILLPESYRTLLFHQSRTNSKL